MPKLAITLGDQAGIGPEIVLKLLTKPENLSKVQVQLLADPEEVALAESQTGLQLQWSLDEEPGKVQLIPSGKADMSIELGKVSEAAGRRVMAGLMQGLAMAKSGKTNAIMFGPLNKTSLKLAGMHHEDELRLFATELEFDGFTSELNILDSLTTARVTSHIPISEVAQKVTFQNVMSAIHLLRESLIVSGKPNPRLGICGLNPHAGENGNFGRQEIDIIAPAVEAAQAEGIDIDGPYPSDTIFATKRHLFDGIVTMYHDQGQIAMKLIGFDSGVTVQGGLPISIATPAHGTAFDLVGQNKANIGASQAAFDYSVRAAIRNAEKNS